MRALVPFTVLLAAFAVAGAAPVMAQSSDGSRPGSNPFSTQASNIADSANKPEVAPSLPMPDLGPNAPPSAFLQAAQGALAAGRTGEAQQALEMAQTRLLDRSVPLFQTNKPSDHPAVREISQALQALGAGDRAASAQHIQSALAAIPK
ncbi:MAG: hypothetical protein AB7O80_22075 [Acetobacteraceae bacterium]